MYTSKQLNNILTSFYLQTKHQKIPVTHPHVVSTLNAEMEYVLVLLDIMGILTLVVTQNV